MPICSLTFVAAGYASVVAAALAAGPGDPASEPGRNIPDIQMQLAWIPPGTFTMGSPDDEPGRRPNEGPRTEVTLRRGFWMGTHEVTHGQWKAIMGTSLQDQVRRAVADDTPYFIGAKQMMTIRDFFGVGKDGDPGQLLGNTDDNLPMIWVSWNEASEFCSRLTGREQAAGRLPAGCEYRLPTEAEWEYACRAGTKEATYAGAMRVAADRRAPVLDSIAWYAGNAAEGYSGHRAGTSVWPEKKYAYERSGPRAVGTLQPNAWGLYDMLGNAAEWCRDWDGPYPGGRVTDWTGPGSGTYHVRRGGSWSSIATQTRAAYRNWHEPTYRWINLGLRVTLAAPISPPTAAAAR